MCCNYLLSPCKPIQFGSSTIVKPCETEECGIETRKVEFRQFLSKMDDKTLILFEMWAKGILDEEKEKRTESRKQENPT
jgi:hypothetical protein